MKKRKNTKKKIEINKNKLQFSKLIVIITFVIFTICLINGLTLNLEDYTDLTVVATSITVSSGLCGSSIIWYLKKSQSENNVKLKIEMYKVVSNERVKYNAKMMILNKKFSLSEEELEKIENSSPMGGFEEEALSEISKVIDISEDEADSFIELQNY